MLERYLTSDREASNNRRTMNREKSWRKTWEVFFFLPTPVHSGWCYLDRSRYTPSNEYKREKWKKKKRGKKRNGHPGTTWSTATLRFEEKTKTFDASEVQKNCMFVLLKITRLRISERELRQIVRVVKIRIYRFEFSQ